MPMIQFPTPMPSPTLPGGINPPISIEPWLRPGVPISPGISPVPSLPSSGSVTKPFAALFDVSVNWRYIMAIFLLLITVQIAETYDSKLAWLYVGILMLGILAVNDTTREALTRNLQGV